MFDFRRVMRCTTTTLGRIPRFGGWPLASNPRVEVFERSSGSKRIVIILGFALASLSLFEFLSVLRKNGELAP